jgi:nuclear pore complex protein Nup160
MYQRARKLQDLASDPSLFTSLVDEQLEAYLFAINCLSLLDRKSAWIILPIFSDNGHEVSVNVNNVICVLSWIKVRKRRKLTRNIPDDKYAEGRHDVEIVDLADIQHDYALLSAQLELLRRDPAMTVMSGEHQRMPVLFV